MKKVLRVGIVGCSRGFNLTAGSWKRDDFEIVALCDKNRENIELALSALKEAGAKQPTVYECYEEMLKADFDAVIVGTDAPSHTEHSVMALNAGKHVLSEIPAVYKLEEVKLLRDACNAHPELIYMVGENCCYWSHIRAWKKMHDEGKFGTVLYAESEYLHCDKTPEMCKPPKDPAYWRAHLPAIRYLTHNLGPLLYILDDEVDKVSCYVPDFNSDPYSSEKKIGIALFHTKKGAIIRIFICFGAYVGGSNHSFALYGSHGTILTDKTKGWSRATSFARFSDIDSPSLIEIPVTAITGASESGHGGADSKMLADFIDCCNNNKKPMFDIDFAIKISLPGIIAEQSYKNGNEALEIPKI